MRDKRNDTGVEDLAAKLTERLSAILSLAHTVQGAHGKTLAIFLLYQG